VEPVTFHFNLFTVYTCCYLQNTYYHPTMIELWSKTYQSSNLSTVKTKETPKKLVNNTRFGSFTMRKLSLSQLGYLIVI
jgi:hypothetical protein